MVGALVGYGVASAQEPVSIYKVGEHAVTLLMSVGDLLIGYLLLRQATVAQEALDNGSARTRISMPANWPSPTGSPAPCCRS